MPQEISNSAIRAAASSSSLRASPRLDAARPSVRQITVVSAPRACAISSAPPKPPLSSSGCAVTHIRRRDKLFSFKKAIDRGRIIPGEGTLCNGSEAESVQRRRAMLGQRALVLRRGISLVRVQSVLRPLLVVFAHAPVAVDLGDHRSSGNGN